MGTKIISKPLRHLKREMELVVVWCGVVWWDEGRGARFCN